MTDYHTLASVIAKLETAKEGSRELGAHILAAIVGGTAKRSEFNGEWCVYVCLDSRGRPRLWEPKRSDVWRQGMAFTTSLDAALTLLPIGWRLDRLGERREADDFGPYVGGWSARLHFPSPGIRQNLQSGSASTASLAVCIAALRAHHLPDQPSGRAEVVG